eukprot:663982_1
MDLSAGSFIPLTPGCLARCLISERILFSSRSNSRISLSISRWDLRTVRLVSVLAFLAASVAVGFFRNGFILYLFYVTTDAIFVLMPVPVMCVYACLALYWYWFDEADRWSMVNRILAIYSFPFCSVPQILNNLVHFNK